MTNSPLAYLMALSKKTWKSNVAHSLNLWKLTNGDWRFKQTWVRFKVIFVRELVFKSWYKTERELKAIVRFEIEVRKIILNPVYCNGVNITVFKVFLFFWVYELWISHTSTIRLTLAILSVVHSLNLWKRTNQYKTSIL